MNNIVDRIKYGTETIKDPIKDNEFSYGKIIAERNACDNCGKCMNICPVNAIKINTITNAEHLVSVDYKKCIYCRNCVDICPKSVLKMTSDYKMAQLELAGDKLREKIYKTFRRSLVLRVVDTGSCNACMSELNALSNTFYDISRFGINVSPSPRHADGLVVTGPVTINMKEALEKTYQAMAEPKIVIAVGSCAYNGGVFKEGDGVYGTLNDILPVDLVIPGCPPSPQAIIFGLLKIMDKIKKTD
ncbi:NADH-quinone oxidoreductase subunit NuoB [Clostridium estertheticum]|uniref:NADH-quinone oxidoreductase subunit NuoB n=1 Tax=Clostridium estertheticum TaxID=238834 RepID=A0A7Y3SXG5_9CLOT|nr:NADH-quinone oxidoreductase subunit NuoB [Clostridium estertheticum]MBW9171865.1 NADH-quinone oxidoreductase subunit NuoB [Clostridium estertheticum]NNU76967.1 NADH-quinone oxidoreductase subunit NuoB [Clostridium estertheticum]WBL47942.1 NADH-quinone oxidoreductase subunit NuoB [Clostridium estertheticum]WLC76030.1 NADH-quinone oxidoreductase subunit NuoB [Clostridium estertheticum]